MPNLEGQTLKGRYRIEELIGRGGMAEVYRAWDMQRQYHVAIKVMREDLAEDVEFLRRFQREARALAALSHANIVRFYSFEREGRLAFIVMDLVEGTTLRGRILDADARPLPVDEVASVMQQVCAALHYAHGENVLHRDVKPGNIMIDVHGRVLVADFGIAKAADAATATTVMPGTPAYMSPEQCRSEPLDVRTDVYSLGIVVYEMLAGRRPFVGDTEATTGSTREKIRWEQLHAEPPPMRERNPELPETLEPVVRKALAKRREDRWADPLAFWWALEETAQAAGVGIGEGPIPSAVLVDAQPAEIRSPSPVPPSYTPAGAAAAGAGRLAETASTTGAVRDPVPAAESVIDASVRSRRGLVLTGIVVVVLVLVVLFIAQGGRGTTVPSVANQAISLARMRLEDAGFMVQVRGGEGYEEGALIAMAQDPAAGERLSRGGRVSLWAATVTPSGLVTVPPPPSTAGTPTSTMTGTVTVAPTGSRTPTPTATTTGKASPTPTSTASGTATSTTTSAPTMTDTATSTSTPTSTNTATSTASPTSTSTPTPTYTPTTPPPEPSASNLIVFHSERDGNAEIYVVRADGSGLTRLTDDPAFDGNPAWSPDGRHIAFVSSRSGNNDIWVMDADGKNERNLTNHPAADSNPTWASRSGRIAFDSDRTGNREIWSMDANGGGLTNLTNHAAKDVQPSWSPDGRHIVFYSMRDGNGEVYTMNADGGAQTRLTFSDLADMTPDWSPDGRRIAFQSMRHGNREIYVMNTDGSNQTRLTKNPGHDYQPSWSPDGSRIVFTSERAGNLELYIMNSDGSGVTRLTNHGAMDQASDWSPK